jgi:hypothetical protein
MPCWGTALMMAYPIVDIAIMTTIKRPIHVDWFIPYIWAGLFKRLSCRA